VSESVAVVTAARESRPARGSRLGPLWTTDELLAWFPVVAFVLAFAVVPVAMLFGQAAIELGGARGFASILVGPSPEATLARRALVNSTVQGGWSALLAFGFGYPVGLALGRHDFPGRGLVLAFLLVPFLLPALVVVLGVQEAFGPSGWVRAIAPSTDVLASGLPGIVLANVFYNAPMIALFTAAAIENASPRLEEAVATLGGGGWQTFRDVWGRGSLLGGLVGGLLTFLLSFLGFAAPLLLGGPANFTVEAWIYALARLYATPAWAAGLAAWTVLFLALPAVAYITLAGRARLLGGRNRGRARLVPFDLRAPRTWPFLAVTAALLLFLVSFLGTIVVRSFQAGTGWGLQNWSLLFSTGTTAALGISTVGAVANSVFFAATSTALVLGLVLLAGFGRVRRERGSLGPDALGFVPVLVSPVILAFALRAFWGSTLGTPGFLWILIVVSQAALAFPFVLQTTTVALRSHSPTLRSAALTLGATRWAVFRTIDLPLLRSALIGGALFAFALSLGEFAATNFLYIPTYTTLVVELYLLDTVRHVGAAAAAGGLLVVLSLVALTALSVGGRRVRF
jgi:thiamine transport system permease protein